MFNIFYSKNPQDKIHQKTQDIKKSNDKKPLTQRLREKIDSIAAEFNIIFNYPEQYMETDEDIIDFIDSFMAEVQIKVLEKSTKESRKLDNLKILARTLELKFLICKYDHLFPKDLLKTLETLQEDANKFIYEIEPKDTIKITNFTNDIKKNIDFIHNKYKISQKIPIKSLLITCSLIIGCLCVISYYSPKPKKTPPIFEKISMDLPEKLPEENNDTPKE